MKLAQRIALGLTLLFLFFDGKLPVNVHLHFHVSANKPGAKSVEKCPTPTPSSITKASGSYYVSGDQILGSPLRPKFDRFSLPKSPCHLLKTAQFSRNGSFVKQRKCGIEVYQKNKKKMVVMKVYREKLFKK